MKKYSKQFSALSLLLLLMFFISCDNNEPLELNNNLEFVPVGLIHNDLLSDLKASNAKFNTIQEVVDASKELLKNNYTEFYNKYPSYDVNSIFIDSRRSLSEHNLVEQFEQKGKELVENGLVPKSFYSFLHKFVSEKPDYNAMLNELENFKKENSNEISLNNNLSVMIATFEDMAYHSNNFWMNISNKSSQRRADECDAAGYIADAATSALLFWNPIGSIIGGLAASYIAEENCRE